MGGCVGCCCSSTKVHDGLSVGALLKQAVLVVKLLRHSVLILAAM